MWVLACGYDGVSGEPRAGCAGHMLVLGQEGGRVALLPPTHTGLKRYRIIDAVISNIFVGPC